MTENNFNRAMLLGVVTLLHVLVLGAVVSLVVGKHIEPSITPPMVLTMLLPSEAPEQPQVKPKPQSEPIPPQPSEIVPEPVIEQEEPLPEPVRVPEPKEPVPEPAVMPPPPAVPPVAAPVVVAPPPPPPAVAVAPSASLPPPAPVVAPRFDAAYLNNPAPVYPALARRKGEQGAVMLRVNVTAEGKPQEVTLHKSSGSPALDKAAIAAVRQWRFVPAKRGEEAVAAWVQVPMVFKLN